LSDINPHTYIHTYKKAIYCEFIYLFAKYEEKDISVDADMLLRVTEKQYTTNYVKYNNKTIKT